jgi:eukaryotic-like serine/threonine-protein kinase
LTGTTPFDRDTFRTAAFDEIRRIIREQEPARPSARISTLGATLTTVSANRHADSRALGKSMRGELDWIVMKALEKDRRRRYETASSFAADVMRYLADQPVEACPPSALYRFRKLGRRNRAALITAGIIALVLIAGTAVSTWQAIRATQAERLVREARDEARRRAEETQQVVDFLASDVFGAAAPEKSHGKAVTVFDILATSDASISARFGKQPLVEAAVRMAMGEAYSAVLQYDKAERQFARAAALRARHLGPEHPDTLQAEDRQASQFSLPQRKEKYEAGEPLARHVLEARRRVLGPEHPKTVDAMRQLVEFLRGVGRLDEALALAEQGFEIETRLHGPSSIEATRMGAALARVLADRRNPRDLERAEALTRKVVEALTRLDPDNTNTFWTTRDLARMIRAQGRTKEARQLYQENLERSCRAFGIDSIETSNALELTGLLHEERDTVALRDLYERLLREDLATPQPKDPYWRSRRSAMLSGLTLGLVTLPEPIAYDTSLTLQGSQEAAALMEMVAADSSARSTYRAELAETCYRLGRIYAKRSEWTEANAAIERSFGLLESFDTSSRPAPLQENQENAANESGQIANACNNVAWFLATDPDPRLRNHPRALDLAQRAVASAPDTAMFWNTLGVAYYRAGEWTKAMAALEKSLAFQAGHEGFDWIFLAMAHQQLGEKDKARARYDKAVVWIEKNRPQDEELRRFREEAAELLGLMKTSDPNGGEPPQ